MAARVEFEKEWLPKFKEKKQDNLETPKKSYTLNNKTNTKTKALGSLSSVGLKNMLDDFTGKYELHTGMYDQAKLLEYIQIYEEQYLIDLFGATLYDEFINDLDNSNYPESPNFQKVFDPFHLDNTSNGFLTSYNTYNNVIVSKGILDMLKGFIYFEYVKDTANQITSQGQKIPQGENSLTATTLYNMMYTRYWEALKTYRAIQWYIYRNQDLPIGSVLELQIMNSGANYPGDDITPALNGTGTGLIIDYKVVGGLVDEVEVSEGGINYLANDVVEIPDGDPNAIIKVVSVTKGDFTKWNGVAKQMAYWL